MPLNKDAKNTFCKMYGSKIGFLMEGSAMVFLSLTQLRSVLSAMMIMVTCLTGNIVSAQERDALPDFIVAEYGIPPEIPIGPMSDGLQAAIKVAFVDSVTQSAWGEKQTLALAEIRRSNDPRVVWVISDLMRFVSARQLNNEFSDVASELLGKNLQTRNSWGDVTDHLIAWDIPAPPNYLDMKRAIFVSVVPE